MTSRVCRFCGEPIEFIEPKESCGWAHRDLPTPDTLRFWCGYDPAGDKLRRVEPRASRGQTRQASMTEPSTAVVCGSSVCPTCGRDTEVLIGPCPECCDSFLRTGRFRRRKPGSTAPLGPKS